MRGKPCDIRLAEQNPSRGDRHEAGYGAEQGRLPAPAGPEQGEDRPGIDRERQAVDDAPVVIGDR
jgi:hypothetical protein